MKGPVPKWREQCSSEIRTKSLWGIAVATGTGWVAGRVRPHHKAYTQSLPVRTSIISSWQCFNGSLIILMDTGGGTDNKTTFSNSPGLLAQHKLLLRQDPLSGASRRLDPRVLILKAPTFQSFLFYSCLSFIVLGSVIIVNSLVTAQNWP